MPIDLAVTSEDVPKDSYITAQIICNQIPLHECPVTTHFSLVDEFKNSLVWDDVLSFPVRFRDLTSDAVIVFTAWTSEGIPFGGTTMHLFDETGCLNRGKKKLIFFFGKKGDPNVIVDENTTPGNLYDLYSQWDHGFAMEKNLEAYRAAAAASEAKIGRTVPSSDARMDWLDRLSLTRIQSILDEALSRNQSFYSGSAPVHTGIEAESSLAGRSTGSLPMQLSPLSNGWGRPSEEIDLLTYCCLVLEMPNFPHQVRYDRMFHFIPQFLLAGMFCIIMFPFVLTTRVRPLMLPFSTAGNCRCSVCDFLYLLLSKKPCLLQYFS